MKRIKKIKAAYKEDIPNILETLNKKKEVEEGLVYCNQCGQTISFDNLGIIIPKEKGIIKFVYNLPECIEQNNI